MKILLTGSTAAQVSASKNANVLTFAGLLNKALLAGGHNVTWIEPSVNMSKAYLAEFDSVVVGMAPPNSTAAHRIYGCLSVIQYANELGTLKLMLDAPEPRRVWAGIRASHNVPEDLTKDFHVKRREYKEALDERVLSRLHEAIRFLYQEKWPTTIYPKFPWMSFPSISTSIPKTDASNLVGLNLDSYILGEEPQRRSVSSDYWVTDTLNSMWTKKIEKTLAYRVIPTHVSRWQSDEIALERIRGAIGCLAATHYQGAPWWSPAISQALHEGIPVVTDWRLSSYLGAPWDVLGSSIEDLMPEERNMLAASQFHLYEKNILPWENAVEFTSDIILN